MAAENQYLGHTNTKLNLLINWFLVSLISPGHQGIDYTIVDFTRPYIDLHWWPSFLAKSAYFLSPT